MILFFYTDAVPIKGLKYSTRISVVMKRVSYRSICNNSLLKTAILLSPVIAFLILLTTCLKRSTVIIPFENRDKKTRNSSSTLFPLVREFALDSKIKHFDNENARKIGFRMQFQEKEANMNSSSKLIYLATKYFNEWNPKHYYFLHLGETTFLRYNCPISNCYVTNNPLDIYKADAVMFHVRDLEVYSFPHYRTPQQIWILYSMEPPWLEVKDFKRLNGYFNWTMSYRRNSTVSIKYGFVGEKPEANTKDLRNLTNIMKQKINRAVWLVSNCNTDSNREEYIKHLMKVYPVDIIGGCGKEGCRPAETKKCYAQLAKRYKFYLAFENAICQNYVTEKLFNSLDYYFVPVTFGGVNYSSLTPSHSVVNAMEFASPEDLGKYLWTVSMNDTLYLSYFAWKVKYRSYLQPWMCELCEKLHEPISTSIMHDLHNWWHEEGSCIRWTESGFKRVEKYAFPKYHLKLFESTQTLIAPMAKM